MPHISYHICPTHVHPSIHNYSFINNDTWTDRSIIFPTYIRNVSYIVYYSI